MEGLESMASVCGLYDIDSNWLEYAFRFIAGNSDTYEKEYDNWYIGTATLSSVGVHCLRRYMWEGS